MDPRHVHARPGLHRRHQGRARPAHRPDDRDLPRRTATTTSSPATASWPRTPSSCAALEEAGLCISSARARTPRWRPARRTRPSARAIENDVSVTPGVERRHDAHAAAPASRTGRRSQKLAKAHGLDVPELADEAMPLADAVERLLEASYRKQVDLYTIDELAETLRQEAAQAARRPAGPALSPEGDRRRRRQGPAHLRRAPPQVPTLVREVLAEVEGDRRRRQQEHPARAQHRADPPQRDPDPRQRRVVHRARRPRLLAADARAEARRGLGHARRPRGRDRRGQGAPSRREEGGGARDRPRHPRAAWRTRRSASGVPSGSTRRPPSSASSTATATTSWR